MVCQDSILLGLGAQCIALPALVAALGSGRPTVLIFKEKHSNYGCFQGLYRSFLGQNLRYRKLLVP